MKRTYRIRIGVYGIAVCALGMLIWARLMLVARPPRMAIAHPVPTKVEPDKAPAQASPEQATPATK